MFQNGGGGTNKYQEMIDSIQNQLREARPRVTGQPTGLSEMASLSRTHLNRELEDINI